MANVKVIFGSTTGATESAAAEIAAACGYPSAQYFAHQFAKTFGMPPNAWRRCSNANNRLQPNP